MILSFDCEPRVAQDVLEALALRMQHLTQQPATRDGYETIGRLQQFASKLGPVLLEQHTPAQVLLCEVQ